MRILSIELEGFKSYGQHTVIDKFDRQFNAITGLNGTGKSNILDSICFLLGITHLKYIRVQKPEELVYKCGTGGITKATVSITFDNTDKKNSPFGYEADSKIVVRRQIVVNGKQTYHVNGTSMSQTKVAEIFNTCSLNVNNPHFLIMQGRVTKVLNMKPMEILFMLEEAAGVHVYEEKKKSALRVMDRKQVKLDQIDQMMEETILPRLEKMRSERRLYEEFNRLGREMDKTKRLQICLQFYTLMTDYDKDTERIRTMETSELERVDRIRSYKQDIEQTCEQLDILKQRLQSEFTGRRTGLDSEQKEHADALSAMMGELNTKTDDVKSTEREIKDTEENLGTERERLDQKKDRLKNFENEAGDNPRKLKDVEAKQKRCRDMLVALEKGYVLNDDGEEISLQQLIMDKNSTRVRTETELKKAENRVSEAKKLLAVKEGELAKRRQSSDFESERRRQTQRIQQLNEEIQKLNFSDEDFRQIQQRISQIESECDQSTNAVDQVRSRYGLDFRYQPPQGFDTRNVFGVLAELIHPKEEGFCRAIEITLGNKLRNIVVARNADATAILKYGNLQQRRTFIPLDDIQAHVIDERRFRRAEELVGQHNVFRAMDLVQYDPAIRRAVEFALGGVLVCKTMDHAKLVCFDRQVSCRVVTFDGEDFNPGGVLSGGGNADRSCCILDVMRVKNQRRTLERMRAERDKLKTEFQRLGSVRQRFLELTNDLDIQNERMKTIMVSMNSDETYQLREEIKKQKEILAENQEVVDRVQPQLDSILAELEDLKKRKSHEAQYQKNEKKKAEDELRAAQRIISQIQESAGSAQRELDILKLDVETTAKQIVSEEEKLVELKTKLVENKRLEAEIKVKVDEAKVIYEEVKQRYDAFYSEQNAAEDDKRRMEGELEQLKRSVQKEEQERLDHQKTILALKHRNKENLVEAKKLEDLHSWISEEKENFNIPDTDYDFGNFTVRDYSRKIGEMEQRRNELEGQVNMKIMAALPEEEERIAKLDAQRRQLKADQDALLETIGVVDSEKKRELEEAHAQISHDFGQIFSTLLPNACARLDKVNPDDVEAGLKFAVGFNNTFKDSLDELSGGQRSLVALSLVLAMLKCNPAPIYILDEVDAALDLSHTANVGRMIKNHFPQSQFIIVSLKEGMFNNANVLFRTQFVNGHSAVRRTVNQPTE